MSKLEDLKGIVAMALQAPVHEFSLEYEDMKISFKKTGSADDPSIPAGSSGGDDRASEPELAPIQPRHAEIVSSMIGTFFIGPEPDAPPFVKIGDRVDRHTVVGVVEAMKLYHELQAEIDGTIEEILVENGQLVHYGQPLFVVRLT